jgi:SAM-dependent methyltransferase
MLTLDQAMRKVAQDFDLHPVSDNDTRQRGIVNTLLEHVRPPARVLDFGAGHCIYPAALALMGFESHASDDLCDDWHKQPGVRDRIMNFATAQGVHFKLLDRDTPWPWEKASFDAVLVLDVLEHLHDSPRDLLVGLVELIKDGGYLMISVPNAGNLKKRIKLLTGGTNLPDYDYFYWKPGAWRGHVREYVRGDLKRLAANLGLEVVRLRGANHMLDRIPAALRLPWRAVTSVFDGLRDSWVMLARKPPGWTPLRELPPDHPLSRSLNVVHVLPGD